MPAKRLRDILHSVDPDLNVVSGGAHRHKQSNQEWLAATAGIKCKVCGREVFKALDGMCESCYNNDQDTRVEVRDKAGILEWMPDAVLTQITHKAGKS